MAKSRALLTETEREQIAGDHGDDRRYQATSRVRSRIAEELVVDIAVLKEHHTDLYDELREAVCDTDDTQPPTDGQDPGEKRSNVQVGGEALTADELQGNPDNSIDELETSDSE